MTQNPEPVDLRLVGSSGGIRERQPGRLSDQVARELELRILSGDYRPGEFMPTESELGDYFAVSRTVIRDANRTLAARDLVDPQPGRGSLVLEPNDTTLARSILGRLARSELSLHEVMMGRALLERGIGPLAATRANPEHRVALREAFERFAAHVRAHDWQEAQTADLHFHQALLEGANQPALQLLLKPMHLVTYVCTGSDGVDTEEAWNVEEHRAIVEAVEAGDEDALRQAIDRHFDYVDSAQYVEHGARPFRAAPQVRALLTGEISLPPSFDGG